jgi:hypothetical protein
MMHTINPKLLAAASSRASKRPGYVAFDLALFEDVVAQDPTTFLRVGQRERDQLALCRCPRRGHHFGHDLMAIAAYVGIDPARLAALMRMVDILPLLQHRVSELNAAGTDNDTVLAAARDEADEHTILTETLSTGPGLPGWLHEAVDQFWADTPSMGTYPRDLDFAILVGLPLALVELPHLTVGAITEWLDAHKLDLDLSDSDRRFRACLVALGGVGLIFVDAGDDATQRRVSLAHEAGHFIVEYLLPRRDVARRRPELLAVLDGERPPTAQERISAILSDVSIGVHTHLLSRGGPSAGRVNNAEWRARRVALELLAPQAAVQQRMGDRSLRDSNTVRRLLEDEFGLPVSLAADYANQLTADSDSRGWGFLDLLSRQSSADDIGGEDPDRTPGQSPEEEM